MSRSSPPEMAMKGDYIASRIRAKIGGKTPGQIGKLGTNLGFSPFKIPKWIRGILICSQNFNEFGISIVDSRRRIYNPDAWRFFSNEIVRE